MELMQLVKEGDEQRSAYKINYFEWAEIWDQIHFTYLTLCCIIAYFYYYKFVQCAQSPTNLEVLEAE